MFIRIAPLFICFCFILEMSSFAQNKTEDIMIICEGFGHWPNCVGLCIFCDPDSSCPRKNDTCCVDNGIECECQDIFCGSTPSIGLIYFRGRNEDNVNILEWATGTENNNDYFVIERIIDKYNIDSIGIVQGVGNSSIPFYYSFIDENPLLGTVYYRLKQVDYDGTYRYIKSVAVTMASKGMFMVRVSPNIISGSIIMNFVGAPGELYKCLIYNSIGQLLYSVSDIPPGKIEISEQLLQSGLYYFKVINNLSESFQGKFVVQ